MVDISYDHYLALRTVLTRSARAKAWWDELIEKQRFSVISKLIEEATTMFGESYRDLLPNMADLSFEAASRVWERGGRESPALYLVIPHDEWHQKSIEDRRMLMDRWRKDALKHERANIPQSEITPW